MKQSSSEEKAISEISKSQERERERKSKPGSLLQRTEERWLFGKKENGRKRKCESNE